VFCRVHLSSALKSETKPSLLKLELRDAFGNLVPLLEIGVISLMNAASSPRHSECSNRREMEHFDNLISTRNGSACLKFLVTYSSL
jgi:hypothetical protein